MAFHTTSPFGPIPTDYLIPGPSPEYVPTVFDNSNQQSRHIGNLTVEQQSKLGRLREDLLRTGYSSRVDDATLVVSTNLFNYLAAIPPSQEVRRSEGVLHVYRYRSLEGGLRR